MKNKNNKTIQDLWRRYDYWQTQHKDHLDEIENIILLKDKILKKN